MDIQVPEQFAAHADAYADAFAAGAAAERTRIATIMDSAEAQAKPTAARSLALMTDMDVAAAMTFLAALPAEASPSMSFDQRAAYHAANGFGASNDCAYDPGVNAAGKVANLVPIRANEDRINSAWAAAIKKANALPE